MKRIKKINYPNKRIKLSGKISERRKKELNERKNEIKRESFPRKEEKSKKDTKAGNERR
jgi:hypothetical protein